MSKEMAELSEIKAEKEDGETTLKMWDRSFYLNLREQRLFKVDQEEIPSTVYLGRAGTFKSPKTAPTP